MAERFEDDLRDLINKRRILVVVGSGISLGATQNAEAASWIGLLKLGAARCRELNPARDSAWEQRVIGEINSGDLDDTLSAAEKISRKLKAPSGGEFRRWLSETVGALQLRETAVLEALRDLQVPLATTTYDSLLEKVTHLSSISWRDTAKVSRFLRREEQGILHLHGHWDEPESVVLGIRSYEEVRQNAHSQAVIRALAMTESLLFVGFGEELGDPNLRPFFSWLGGANAGNEARHYRLALERDVIELQRQHAVEERVRVLAYGPNYEALPGFLKSLCPRKVPASPKPRIFISYRRDDAAAHAGRLCDKLCAHFKESNIFMDLGKIKPGDDFVEVIKGEVEACDTMLVLIGRQWLTITDENGLRRLDCSDDQVRSEVEAGLNGGLKVIPVSLQGAAIPGKQQLPASIRKLANLNASELSETRWDYDVGKLIEAICEPVKPGPEKDEPLTPPVAAYLERLEEATSRLQLIGLGQGVHVELPIQQAYIPLNVVVDRELEHKVPGAFEAIASQNAEHEEGIVELSDVFLRAKQRDYRGVILLGDPGAGKTTGARQFCWRLLKERARPDKLGFPKGTIPVFLRLRNLTREQLTKNLKTFIVEAVAAPSLADDVAHPGRDLLRRKGVLWVFDGLDEVVNEEARIRVCRWIQQALDDRPSDYFFVTSRYQGYLGRVDLGPAFLQFHVKPLNSGQMADFVDHWYRTVYRKLQGAEPAVEKKAVAAARSLLDLLEQSEYRIGRLRELSANPLLLTILCVVHHQDRNMPRRRADLYSKCVRVLMEHWRKEMREIHGLAGFDPEAAEGVLSAVAWWLHTKESRTTQTVGEMGAVAGRALADLAPGAGLSLGRGGEEFIRRMRDECGILAMWGAGQCGFLHLTFQEYLAGFHAAREGLVDELVERTESSWWREVILIALALGSKSFSHDFFAAFLKTEALAKQGAFVDQCLNDVRYVVIEPFIEALREKDATPERQVDILRRLRQFDYPELVAVCKELAFAPVSDLSALAREVLRRAGVEPPSNFELADSAEKAARGNLASCSFEPAWGLLQEAIRYDGSREQRLRDEFGFLANAVKSDGCLADNSSDSVARLDWCCRVWEVLSNRNSFRLPEIDSKHMGPYSEAIQPPKEVKETEVPSTRLQENKTPEQKGEQLEQAVGRLFHAFFRLGNDVPLKVRQQMRGTQGGYDLSIEWSGKCEVEANPKVRCHIECKNYKKQITLNEVAEKLLAEPRRNPVIDHWILISPRSDPSNPLNEFLEKQKDEETFPFDVQVWSPETGIAEFFGLEPDIYDFFFSPAEGGGHPKHWDESTREAVRAKWRKKLDPPLPRLPGRADYVRQSDLLCIHQENPAEMERTFENFVQMSCRNNAGALLEKPLDAYVDEWLATPKQPALFLLGEFGDGKSFYTYSLARRLVAGWKIDRKQGWLPLRLALRTFPGKARDFLRDRLEVFNANVGGWYDLGKTSRRLVILDGFDEMSVEIDPATVIKNIKALLACLDEFKDCKVIVTSRTYFFANRKDARRLLTRVEAAPIYHLAPIGRSQVLNNVSKGTSGVGAQQLLHRLHAMNDPIGLAGKPLFLEMLKNVLSDKDLPRELDVVALYERYIYLALHRRVEFLDERRNLSLDPEDIIRNLRLLLGEIAEELQRVGKGYVLLERWESVSGRPYAQLLWQLSGTEELSEDARNRVGVRSLLGRVVREGLQDEWPVDFCHRSMREYFVALRLCEAVEAGVEPGAKFLREVPVNHEILEFAAEKWRKAKPEMVRENLLKLIAEATPSAKSGRLGGSALTLLHRVEPRLPQDFNWKGKVFDGVDLEGADLTGFDFSRSSFRFANLANVTLENANFEKCDLTGVHLEETAPVMAIGQHPSREHLLAAYRDGVLRQWHLKPGGRTPSKILAKLPLESGCTIGVHQSGQGWVRNGSAWMFFACDDDKGWRQSGHFTAKDAFDCVCAQQNFLALSEKIGTNESRVCIVDLEQRGQLCAIPSNPTRHCAALGDEAVVWSDVSVGIRVKLAARNARLKGMVLPCAELTCLDVRRAGQGAYLVAAGTTDGSVHVWKVAVQGGDLTEELLLKAQTHQGSVTAVAVIDDTRVATGGADCAIVVERLTPTGDTAGQVERKLQLRMRCRGLKIDGVQGEAEHTLLMKLIEAADSPEVG